MTIILFLVDTSASMYQRVQTTTERTTILDITKNAIELFVKCRQRNAESRGDRYMLLTFDEAPENIKAGWKENLQTFMRELRNLECTSRTFTGEALRQAFELLNLNRTQTGIDTYGQGRSPFYIEPAIVVLITDGGRYSVNSGVTDELQLHHSAILSGATLNREIFRWDQRLYALILRIPGVVPTGKDPEFVPRDDMPIDHICESTGGRSYRITSHKMMLQCIESLVSTKLQSGVVIKFEMISFDEKIVPIKGCSKEETFVSRSNSNNHSNKSSSTSVTRNFVYVPRSSQKTFATGFWPIPESYWPDGNLVTLPARNAQPHLKVNCTNHVPVALDHIPYDRYELEPSQFTQQILSRKEPDLCWPIYISNSGKMPDSGQSCGILKVNNNLTRVYLIILPYNYRLLIPQLEELVKTYRLKPSQEFMKSFHNSLASIPVYYLSLLRRALLRLGASISTTQSLIPDYIGSQLNYNIQTYLQKIRTQAKSDFEVLCNRVIFQQTKRTSDPTKRIIEITTKSLPKKEYVTHPAMARKYYPVRDYIPHLLALSTSRTVNTSLKNPFEIQRSRILDQVVRMRINFLQPISQMKLFDSDVSHSLPISEMGNYQNFLKYVSSPLRTLEPEFTHRSNMFGNPFKKINTEIMVDEADVDLGDNENRSSISHGEIKSPPKRRPGPLPRTYLFKRSADNGANYKPHKCARLYV